MIAILYSPSQKAMHTEPLKDYYINNVELLREGKVPTWFLVGITTTFEDHFQPENLPKLIAEIRKIIEGGNYEDQDPGHSASGN